MADKLKYGGDHAAATFVASRGGLPASKDRPTKFVTVGRQHESSAPRFLVPQTVPSRSRREPVKVQVNDRVPIIETAEQRDVPVEHDGVEVTAIWRRRRRSGGHGRGSGPGAGDSHSDSGSLPGAGLPDDGAGGPPENGEPQESEGQNPYHRIVLDIVKELHTQMLGYVPLIVPYEDRPHPGTKTTDRSMRLSSYGDKVNLFITPTGYYNFLVIGGRPDPIQMRDTMRVRLEEHFVVEDIIREGNNELLTEERAPLTYNDWLWQLTPKPPIEEDKSDRVPVKVEIGPSPDSLFEIYVDEQRIMRGLRTPPAITDEQFAAAEATEKTAREQGIHAPFEVRKMTAAHVEAMLLIKASDLINFTSRRPRDYVTDLSEVISSIIPEPHQKVENTVMPDTQASSDEDYSIFSLTSEGARGSVDEIMQNPTGSLLRMVSKCEAENRVLLGWLKITHDNLARLSLKNPDVGLPAYLQGALWTYQLLSDAAAQTGTQLPQLDNAAFAGYRESQRNKVVGADITAQELFDADMHIITDGDKPFGYATDELLRPFQLESDRALFRKGAVDVYLSLKRMREADQMAKDFGEE